METSDLFFRTACYPWLKRALPKNKENDGCKKHFRFTNSVLFIFGTWFIQRSYETCKKKRSKAKTLYYSVSGSKVSMRSKVRGFYGSNKTAWYSKRKTSSTWLSDFKLEKETLKKVNGRYRLHYCERTLLMYYRKRNLVQKREQSCSLSFAIPSSSVMHWSVFAAARRINPSNQKTPKGKKNAKYDNGVGLQNVDYSRG
jgi:hypothetical protein